jgi:gamma-glutamyltranspeptidase/glutathione hydrolase
MNIQAALEAPRFTIAGTAEPIGCRLLIESRVKPDVVEELRKNGHNIVVRQEYSGAMGRGQAVLHNSATGTNFGASDPRADGSAEPEPPPQP